MDLSWVSQTHYILSKLDRRGRILQMLGQQYQKQVSKKEHSKSPVV